MAEHSLTLEPRNSGLQQRSLSRWSVVYLNTELWQAQMWLQSVLLPIDHLDDQLLAHEDTKKPMEGKRAFDSWKTTKDHELEARRAADNKKGITESRSGREEREKSGKGMLDVRSVEGGTGERQADQRRKGGAGEEGKDIPSPSLKMAKSDTDKRGEVCAAGILLGYSLWIQQSVNE